MQTSHMAELKAYEEKVASQLEHAKAKLHGLEAQFKGKKAELEMIDGLRTAQHDIERRTKELKALGETVAEARTAQLKAEIDAALANVNAGLAELSRKTHSTTRAS